MVMIVAARTLLYETTRYVDLRDTYEELVAHGSEEQVTLEVRQEAKRYARIAAELTPLSKALSTELANQVSYDSLQIHGGTGYMKDFNVERYCRDARITNIYEGTTQMQIVAALGGVTSGIADAVILEILDRDWPAVKKNMETWLYQNHSGHSLTKLNRALR